METEEIPNLKVVDEEDGTVIAERGLVMTHGTTAKIYDWDMEGHRYRQVDRLTEATLKRSKQTSRLTGTSDSFRREVGVSKEQAARTVKLMHGQGKPLVDVKQAVV